MSTFINHRPPAVATFSYDDPKYQGNRYGDPKSNFEVLSICPMGVDDSKGKMLSENIDNIKLWLAARWGLPNDSFPIKCKIIIAPDKMTFKELFGKESPQYRVTDKEINIWLSADDPRWCTSILTNALTEVYLESMEKQHGLMPYWIHRGMPIMNGDLASIRQKIGNLYTMKDGYSSKDILNMTPEILSKQPQLATWFDSESAALLLMFYKEFGPQKFNLFIAQCHTNPEVALKVYGFNSYAECDVVFRQYMLNLSSDITGHGKQVTPNSYLTFPIK